jgi:hypothetical protein
MKLSIILATLVAAKLPSVNGEQLHQLVGTAEGKAFAEDLKWFAAGEVSRRPLLAAVVHALSPSIRQSVEQMGLQFDVLVMIAAAKRDGERLFDTLKNVGTHSADRAQMLGYLRGIGLTPAKPSSATQTAIPIEPPYYSFKVFGGSAALCISEARTRVMNQCTVQVEGAVLLGGGSRHEFDWRNKITVQLTVQEAYLALALFENLIPSVKFDGHGRTHDKSLQIESQASHYFVRIIQRGRAAVAVPVRPVDAIPIVALLYKQLLRNEPHLRIDDIRAMVERMAQMVRLAPQAV